MPYKITKNTGEKTYKVVNKENPLHVYAYNTKKPLKLIKAIEINKKEDLSGGIRYGISVWQLKDIIQQFIDDGGVIKPKIRKLKKGDKEVPTAWRSMPRPKLLEVIKENGIDIRKYKLPEKNPNPPLPTNILSKFKRKPYKAEEQMEYLQSLAYNERFKNPLKALNTYTNKEGTSEFLDLQKHQRDFIKQFIYSNLRGAIAFHGVGSGKTLTAVVSAYFYLKVYPQNKVLVISPSSLLFNFINGMVQYGLDIGDNRFTYTTYEKYARKPIIAKDTLLIIDEAHNFRTFIKTQEITDPDTDEVKEEIPFTNKKGFYTMKYGTDYAHKVMLLTGTAFVNGLYDIENLMAMVDKRKPIERKTFGEMIVEEEGNGIADYFKYRISYYETSKEGGFFPDRKEEYIFTYMTPEEEELYDEYKQKGRYEVEGIPNPRKIIQTSKDDDEGDEEGEGDPNAFKTAERYAVNKIGMPNPKIDWIVKKLESSPNQKFIIYSGLIDAGINQLIAALRSLKIGYKIISGRESTTAKEDAKRFYNGYNYGDANFFDESKMDATQKKYINDEFRVLLITRAGAEGVDTINTQNIILLDGVWNDATSEQIIARAIRYKSHHGLPVSERKVNVYKMFLVRKSEQPLANKIKKYESGTATSEDWQNLYEELSGFKRVNKRRQAIEDGKYVPLVKDLKEVMNNEGQPYVSAEKWNEYKVIKDPFEKKRWLRETYMDWYNEFGEEQERIKNEAADDYTEPFDPSADVSMFLLAKNKQATIDEFINKFGNDIKLFEDYQSKLLPIIAKQEQELKRPLTEEEQVDIYTKVLRQMNVEILKTNYEPVEPEKRDTEAQKQQYFTNEILAEYIIKKSSLPDVERKVDVLEGTAGDGALVRPILKLNKDLTIDLIEIDEKYREKLRELIKLSPASLNLCETKNFLKYIPSKRYDYIFMNPPFHIRRSENAFLISDVWDYDFIRRAYAMLNIGGELIAITSKKWQMEKQAQKFYEKVDAKIEERKKEKFGNVRIDVSIIKIIKMTDTYDDEILAEHFYKVQEMNIGLQIIDNNISLKEGEKIEKTIEDIYKEFGIEGIDNLDVDGGIKINPPPIADDPNEVIITPKIDVPKSIEQELQEGLEWLASLDERGAKYDEKGGIEPVYFSSVGDYMSSTMMLFFQVKYNTWGYKCLEIKKEKNRNGIEHIKKYGLYLRPYDKRSTYDNNTNDWLEDISDSIKADQKMANIYIGLTPITNHANTLIINYETLEAIRFEPHGGEFSSISGEKNAKNTTINNEYVNRVKDLNSWLKSMGQLNKKKDFVFVSPAEITPTTEFGDDLTKKKYDKQSGFQSMENYYNWEQNYKLEEKLRRREIEGGGFCALWSIFFMELVLKNPRLNVKELYQKAYDFITITPEKFAKLIRGYFHYANDETHELFKEYAVFSRTDIVNKLKYSMKYRTEKKPKNIYDINKEKEEKASKPEIDLFFNWYVGKKALENSKIREKAEKEGKYDINRMLGKGRDGISAGTHKGLILPDFHPEIVKEIKAEGKHYLLESDAADQNQTGGKKPTYREQFNKKYGFPLHASHSLKEISELTGYALAGLKTIVKKGEGAYYSNPQSVRPHINSPTEWGIARLYSAISGGDAERIDASHLIKKDLKGGQLLLNLKKHAYIHC